MSALLLNDVGRPRRGGLLVSEDVSFAEWLKRLQQEADGIPFAEGVELPPRIPDDELTPWWEYK